MEPISIILLFILVGFAAFFFAPLGLGGGLLFVPILHYVAGWEITPVTLLTSLILTAAVSWASGIKHRSEGLYDDELTKIALYGAIPGALIGALLVNIMENNLDFAFKVVSLAMLAYAMLRMRNRLTQEEVSQDMEESQNRSMITLGSGLGGMTSAFLAVGGVRYTSQFWIGLALLAQEKCGCIIWNHDEDSTYCNRCSRSLV